MNWEEDYKLYQQIIGDYEKLSDNDPLTAYGLMKRASSLKTRFDEHTASFGKLFSQLERQAKGIESRVSSELCKSGEAKSVADGDRKASYSQTTLDAWDHAFDAKRLKESWKGYADHLERIYFDAKDVWNLGRRMYREGRDGA